MFGVLGFRGSYQGSISVPGGVLCGCTGLPAFRGFKTRFPSSPLIIRVPFFLLLGFNKGPKNEKGKRVLLGHLEKDST